MAPRFRTGSAYRLTRVPAISRDWMFNVNFGLLFLGAKQDNFSLAIVQLGHVLGHPRVDTKQMLLKVFNLRLNSCRVISFSENHI